MTEFAQTQRALADDYYRLASLRGERQSASYEIGMMGAPVGYREYDPARDLPSHVDTLSPLGVATGEDYVRRVPKELALQINVGVDLLPRKERPDVTARKTKVAESIVALLRDALPYYGDRLATFGVFERGKLPNDDRKLDELFPVTRRQGFVSTAAEKADEDLPTVLISDFHGMNFPRRGMSKTIALMVKDISELRVVDEALAVSLGGDTEIHTRDKEQTKQYESLLDEQHQEAVDRLRSIGMIPVSIITAINSEAGYDVPEADKGIAAALRIVAQRA